MNMQRMVQFACAAFLGTASLASAAVNLLGYEERDLKYPHRVSQSTWDDALKTHWTAWKSRFVTNGLVKGNDPQGNFRSISEGQSYGMLMSLWMNDQTAFNTIWTATENSFWRSSRGYYAWLTSGDDNYAGDADQDICGALIFASALVDSGYWKDYTVNGNDYKAKAKIVLKSIATNLVDKSNNYRINSWPGAGDGTRNPSYHMPQWYPIFRQFDSVYSLTGSLSMWDNVATGAYDLINAQPNSNKGMARNFSTGTGGYPSSGVSSPNNHDMGFDAIRVPYRMGMAAMWNHDSRAVKWCKSVWSTGFVRPDSAGMYSIDGPSLYGWGTAGNNYQDSKYEVPMTDAMWAVSALGVADSDAVSAAAFLRMAQKLQGYGLSTLDYFSTYTVSDSTVNTSQNIYPPNKNYFAQSLGLLGAIAMAGRAPNVWGDLKYTWTVPDTAAHLTTALAASKLKPVYLTDTVTFTAAFTKAVTCTLWITGKTSGAIQRYIISPATAKVSQKWFAGVRIKGNFSETGEDVSVVLKWPGMSASTTGNTLTLGMVSQGTGIDHVDQDRAYVRQMSNGAITVHQPWFSGDVHVRLRNAAGIALYQGVQSASDRQISLPSLTLAPGWYAVETESAGKTALQHFTLTR